MTPEIRRFKAALGAASLLTLKDRDAMLALFRAMPPSERESAVLVTVMMAIMGANENSGAAIKKAFDDGYAAGCAVAQATTPRGGG